MRLSKSVISGDYMRLTVSIFIVFSLAAGSLMANWVFPETYEIKGRSNGQYEPENVDGIKHYGDKGFDKFTPEQGEQQFSKHPHAQQLDLSAKPLEQQYPKLIVMFSKERCPYCVYMKPIMEQVERSYGDDIKFLYVDITENPQYPSQYGFSTVPHIVYFKNGKQLDAHGSGDKTMTVDQVIGRIKNLGLAK